MSVRDYDSTPSNNTTISSIDISEGCSPSGINNAIRQQLADIKDVSVGTVALESPKFDSILDGNIKATDASGTDTAGTATTIKGGAGTGTGAGGSIVFQVADGAGSTGSSVNAHATAVTITDDGNVGIGTTSPTGKLEVAHTGTNASPHIKLAEAGDTREFNIFNDGSGNGRLVLADSTDDTSETEIVLADNGIMQFKTGDTERMRIDSSGNLLVGTTTHYSASYRMSIAPASGTGGIVFQNNSTSGVPYAFLNLSGTVIGYITTSNTSTAYVTTSDYRLKENVTATWDATTRLKQLNPVRFNFIDDADTTVDGFLAHEVQSVVPEAISGTKDEVDDEGNPVYQGVDQSKLVPLLVKTIQELEARVAALENA